MNSDETDRRQDEPTDDRLLAVRSRVAAGPGIGRSFWGSRALAIVALASIGVLTAALVVWPRALPGLSDVPEPTPALSESASPSDDASPSQETSPTPDASPSPDGSPAEGPSASPSDEPSGSPDPSPSGSPTLEPTPAPTPAPTIKPAGPYGPGPLAKYKPGKKLACGLYGGSAVRLLDGRVLVWGNCNPVSEETIAMPVGWSELLDPTTGIFTPTGSSSIGARLAAAPGELAVLLDGGQVFFPIGEAYDPSVGRYFPTGLETYATSIAKLNDGRVLLMRYDDNLRLQPQVYDPVTGSIGSAGVSAVDAAGVAATLADGRVLLLGGLNDGRTAQVYDPRTRKFTALRKTTASRGYGTSIQTLADGRLLIVGSDTSAAVEVFDPAKGFGKVAAMPKAMSRTVSVTLADGRILVVGVVNGEKQPSYGLHDDGFVLAGGGASGGATGSSGGLYDRKPSTGRFPIARNMTGPFNYTAEIYDPVRNRWTVIGHLGIQRTNPALVALPDGRAVVLAGLSDTAEFFDPRTNKFTPGR